MPSTSGGLNFDFPEEGEINFYQTMKTLYDKISSHDHSGGGDGLAIAVTDLSGNGPGDFTPAEGPDTTSEMSNLSSLTGFAKYRDDGSVVDIFMNVTFDLSGISGNYVDILLPVATSIDGQRLSATIVDVVAAPGVDGFCEVRSGPDTMRIYKYDRSNWTDGTSKRVTIQGQYLK